MKLRFGLIVAAVALVAACEKASTTAPQADLSVSVLFDQQGTLDSASLVPRGPSYDTSVPDSVKLTPAQEAAIKALHDAFAAAHKAQFDQLKAIHDEAAAAVKAGKTRTEVAAILIKSRPIMEALRPDFEALRAAIGAILTPAQKAWAASHQRQGPGPMGMPMMPGRP